jgi:hypothetical protein
MATKEQYEFFRSLYDEEERTYEQLEGRAKLYLTIVSLFLAGLLLKADETRKSAAAIGLPWWVLGATTILLAGTLALLVVAMRIRTYEGASDPEEIVKGFGEKPPKDEVFFDDRIADYVVATNRNTKVNNSTAMTLQYASYSLAAAMLLLLVALVFTFQSVGGTNAPIAADSAAGRVRNSSR